MHRQANMLGLSNQGEYFRATLWKAKIGADLKFDPGSLATPNPGSDEHWLQREIWIDHSGAVCWPTASYDAVELFNGISAGALAPTVLGPGEGYPLHTLKVGVRQRHTVQFLKGVPTGMTVKFDRELDSTRPWLLKVVDVDPKTPAHRRLQEDFIITGLDNFRVTDAASAENVLEHLWQYETPSKLMEFQVRCGFKTYTIYTKGG